jgi:hypothetical protein
MGAGCRVQGRKPKTPLPAPLLSHQKALDSYPSSIETKMSHTRLLNLTILTITIF